MNGCEISTKSGAVWNAFPMDAFKSGLTTLEAKLHGIPTVSWLKSAAPKKYFPGGSNFQQVSNTSKCSKIFEDTLQILSRYSPDLLRFMVSPEARVQFSDSQRFKELSALLPIVRRKQGTGETGWNGRNGVERVAGVVWVWHRQMKKQHEINRLY